MSMEDIEPHGAAWAFRQLMAAAQRDIESEDGEIKPARRIYPEPDARVHLHAIGCPCADCECARIDDAWDPRMGPK
jgi:hypothetical protein